MLNLSSEFCYSLTVTSLTCWKCDTPLEGLPERIPFRETCEACSAYLHCCVACVHYQPGLPNDCRIPDTEPIADREKYNYCEEFKPGAQKQKHDSVEDVERRLFGED